MAETKALEHFKGAPASEITYMQLFETSWRFLSTNCPLSNTVKSIGDLAGKKLFDLYNYHRTSAVIFYLFFVFV